MAAPKQNPVVTRKIHLDVRLWRLIEKRKLLQGEGYALILRNALAAYFNEDPEHFHVAEEGSKPRRSGRSEAPLTTPLIIDGKTLEMRRSDGLIPYNYEKDGPITADLRYLIKPNSVVTLKCSVCKELFTQTVSKHGRVRQTRCRTHRTYVDGHRARVSDA